jgi:hypothetical protein
VAEEEEAKAVGGKNETEQNEVEEEADDYEEEEKLRRGRRRSYSARILVSLREQAFPQLFSRNTQAGAVGKGQVGNPWG